MSDSQCIRVSDILFFKEILIIIIDNYNFSVQNAHVLAQKNV